MIQDQTFQPQNINQTLTPEQKQELTEKANKVRAELNSVNAIMFANKNIVETKRKEIMKQVFTNFQKAGVNLTDRDAVSKFIMNLQQTEPELAQMFEKSMGALIGEQNDGLED